MAENEELSEGSRRVIAKCFGKYDKNGNGILETKELSEALQFAGIACSSEEVAVLNVLFDKNGDGKIQISELLDNWQVLAQHSVNGDELLKAFNVIDKNKDRFIRIPELKVVLTKAGEKWELNEAEACLRTLMKYDTDGDGKFSYPEFVQMYTENMYPFKKPEKVEKKDITQEYEQVKSDQRNGEAHQRSC